MKDFRSMNRRTLIKTGAVAVAAPALLGANSASAQGRVIKIGHVSPRTGPLAGFGETDTWLVDQMGSWFAAHPIEAGGKSYNVEIILKIGRAHV